MAEEEAANMEQSMDTTVQMENTVLTEHLSRIITRKGGDQFHLQLEALEDDDMSSHKESDSGKAGGVKFGNQRISSKPTAGFDISVPLSLEEKSEIAEDEFVAVKQEIVRYKEDSERVLDDLKAVLEETEISIGELRKEKHNFEREVMFEAQLRSSKSASTDRILSYIEEKLKGKQTVISKLQERNDLYQARIADAERQLTNKKDLSDILHSVDFDQIAIQNEQLANKIEDKTHEFHRIKARSNKAFQALESVRKELQSLQQEGAQLKEKIKEDSMKLDRVSEEIKTGNKTKKKLKELLDIGTQESDGPSPPNALEYMQLKETSNQLHKEMESWKKKIEVAELTSGQLEKHIKHRSLGIKY